jgi:hypothetical protein
MQKKILSKEFVEGKNQSEKITLGISYLALKCSRDT